MTKLELGVILTPIDSLNARQYIIRTHVDSQIAQMPNDRIQGAIKNAWQLPDTLTTRTRGAVKIGVACALAARTRAELFDTLPSHLMLNPDTRRSGKANNEVLENIELQSELNKYRKRKSLLSVDERVEIASLVARLAITEEGLEVNTAISLDDRLKFIDIAASVITRFIIDNNHGLVQTHDIVPKTTSVRKQRSVARFGERSKRPGEN